MILALAELRRTPRRFLSIGAAVGFIVFLALILSALSDGLYVGSTGAYRTSSAELFVFEEGSDFQLADSTLSEETFAAVSQAAEVGNAGRLSSFNTTATSDSVDLQLTLVGADRPTFPSDIVEGGFPEPGALEVVVDGQLSRRGIGVGSVISITDGPDLEVVGVATDAGFGIATAWISSDAFDSVRSEVRPELAAQEETSQAIGITLVDASTSASGVLESVEGVIVASSQQAIDALPAASQQKATLGAITNTTFLVAAIVVGLFFALITLEKRNQFAVLKAVGMANRTLLGGIFIQSLMASSLGYLIGLGLARLVGLLIPADVPALFLGGTALFVLGSTLAMGAVGAVFSFRRIIRIDPATALGGAT